MDESVVKHFEADQKVGKLSTDVRKAAKMFPECFHWSGCALGSVARMHGAEVHPVGGGGKVFSMLQAKYGVPYDVLRQASVMHAMLTRKYYDPRDIFFREAKPHKDCRPLVATWLESQGY